MKFLKYFKGHLLKDKEELLELLFLKVWSFCILVPLKCESKCLVTKQFKFIEIFKVHLLSDKRGDS